MSWLALRAAPRHAPFALALLLGFVVQAPASAQFAFDPSSTFGPFIPQARLPVAGPAWISGDTILVAAAGVVHVYERDLASDAWSEVAQLTPADGAPAFAQRSIALEGDTIVVGAEGGAYVFRRGEGTAGSWRETARLVPAGADPVFGGSLDVSGSHAIVSGTDAPYIFRREEGGEAWQAVARLPPAFTGQSVRISGDLAAVASISVRTRIPIFWRHQGGTDNWGLVATADGWEGFSGLALDGDVLAHSINDPYFGSRIWVYRFDHERNAWAAEALYRNPFRPQVCCLSLSGDWMADIGFSIAPSRPRALDGFRINARNQGLPPPYTFQFDGRPGGPNQWGPVSTFVLPFPLRAGGGPVISGDTAVLPIADSHVEVVVSDIDGDGIRDGRDSCVRDPLNNVEQGCRRAVWAHLAQDDRITMGDVTTVLDGDEFLITVTFTNHSDTAVRNPFFAVSELTGGNLLVNADEGSAGQGATLSPDVGDGILSPGEETMIVFRIRLITREPFQFFVTFHGDTP